MRESLLYEVHRTDLKLPSRRHKNLNLEITYNGNISMLDRRS